MMRKKSKILLLLGLSLTNGIPRNHVRYEKRDTKTTSVLEVGAGGVPHYNAEFAPSVAPPTNAARELSEAAIRREMGVQEAVPASEGWKGMTYSL